jgi:large subunit ribosomal protein L15
MRINSSLFNLNTLFRYNLFTLSKFGFCNLNVAKTITINIDEDNRTSLYSVNANNIKDNLGARKPKTRLGRGPGSGKGKTSGRGHKGYTARTGEPHRHFEGGQTPISRRLPKHGFRRTWARENFSYINIDKIIYLIQKKRLDSKKTITIKDIFYAGGISKLKNGVKLLGRGVEKLSEVPPLNFEISSASKEVIDSIKKHGGSVTCIHRTKLTLRYHTKPHKFIQKPLDPVAKFKKAIRIQHLEEKGAK